MAWRLLLLFKCSEKRFTQVQFIMSGLASDDATLTKNNNMVSSGQNICCERQPNKLRILAGCSLTQVRSANLLA